MCHLEWGCTLFVLSKIHFGSDLDFATAAAAGPRLPLPQVAKGLLLKHYCQGAQHHRQHEPEERAEEGGTVRGITVGDGIVHTVGRLSAAAGPGSAALTARKFSKRLSVVSPSMRSIARLAEWALRNRIAADKIAAAWLIARLSSSAAFRAPSIDR